MKMQCKKCNLFKPGASVLWDDKNEWYFDLDGSLLRCPVCGSFLQPPSRGYLKRENQKRKMELKERLKR